MRKFIVAIILLIIFIGLAILLFAHDNASNGKLVLTNDLGTTDMVKIVCEPPISKCAVSIESGKKATYKGISKLELYIGSWYKYKQYDLYLPEEGLFNLGLKNITLGNVPMIFRLRCYYGEYNKRTIEINCKTHKPL